MNEIEKRAVLRAIKQMIADLDNCKFDINKPVDLDVDELFALELGARGLAKACKKLSDKIFDQTNDTGYYNHEKGHCPCIELDGFEEERNSYIQDCNNTCEGD